MCEPPDLEEMRFRLGGLRFGLIALEISSGLGITFRKTGGRDVDASLGLGAFMCFSFSCMSVDSFGS